MKRLAIVLAAIVLLGTGAAQAEDPSNKSWSPNLQVPDRAAEPEPLDWYSYKYDCGPVLHNHQIKPQYRNRELSKGQCLREIRKTEAFLKTWPGNVSGPLIACAVYCSGLYKIPF